MTSAARRLSAGGGRSTVLIDSMDSCFAQMTSIVSRLKANKEGVEAEDVTKWYQRLQELSHSAAAQKAMKTTAETVAQEVLRSREQDAPSSSSDSSSRNDLENEDSNLLKEVRTKTEAAMKQFDAKSSNQVVQLQQLMAGQTEDVDDEIEMVDTGYTESDMSCPFTSQPFSFKENMPYGNKGGGKLRAVKCKHHVSELGLEGLCRNGKGNCPMPGCKGTWARDGVFIDKDFMMDLEIFRRRKRRQVLSKEAVGSSSSAATLKKRKIDTIDISPLKDGETEYTQV